jgi:hypothetical protein
MVDERFNVCVIEDGGVVERFNSVEEARRDHGPDCEIYIESDAEHEAVEAYFEI